VKKWEKYGQEILTSYPEGDICLVCKKKKCNHSEEIKILLHYVNCWGDDGCYEFAVGGKQGYHQAIHDVMDAAEKIFMRQVTKEVNSNEG